VADSRAPYDIAVLGGGLAGSLAARQLRRRLPSARILLCERSSTRSWKVGESSVEIACNAFTRKLGLSRYLYEQHLPKNGLRFFFDNEQRSGHLESLSEIGTSALPILPTFQIDRARMETDLLAMNASDGVDVVFGKASALTLGSGSDLHRFELTPNGSDAREAVRARWVVDATGRAGLLAKPKKLWTEESHRVAAVWGRLRNLPDFDDLGSSDFRSRVRHTSRHLSTTHFCYPGLWIWFIPLGEGVVSVGAVMDRARWSDAYRKSDGFLDFLRGHAAVKRLLEGGELLDVMSYGQLAYGGTRWFSAEERWALTGEAAAFTDPLYSPGSDFIALGNDLLTDLVARDLGGDGADALARRGQLYDAFMKFRFDSTMLVYRDLYSLLGSFDLWSLKWDFDLGSYYDLSVEPFMLDLHLETDWLETQLRQSKLVLGLLGRYSALFKRVEIHLAETGQLHRNNLGRFQGEFPTIAGAAELGTPASHAKSIDRMTELLNTTRRRAHGLLGREAPADLTMPQLLAGRPLV
jgi:flavin-dependent dehydrogenase